MNSGGKPGGFVLQRKRWSMRKHRIPTLPLLYSIQRMPLLIG